MPDNRLNERLLRIRAIDELFASQPCLTFTPEEIISHVLSKNSSWTYNRFKLARDLKFMEQERGIKIFKESCESESNRGRKGTKYGYENSSGTLYQGSLSENDKRLIKDILESLDMKGISSLNSFVNFDIKYGKEISKTSRPIVSFTKSPDEPKISKHFATLYEFIQNKTAVRFKMRSRNYPYEQDIYHVHPWYLREYNRRWYLFGLDVKENKIKRYALDRIEGQINILKKEYISPTQSIEDILSTIIGVSLTETEPIEVIFWVSDESADYVARKKMHHTQKEISIAEDSPFMEMIGYREHGKFFKVKCENNYELRREMLSFNSELIVLAPESFRKEIKENIERMHNNYKDSAD